MLNIKKIRTFLVDFDGVITDNSNFISLAFLEDFINRYTPFKRKNIEDFYKSTNSFPVSQRISILLNSLGLQDKNIQFKEESLEIDVISYKGITVTLDESFERFYKSCEVNGLICNIFTATSPERMKRFGFIPEADIYNNGGLSKGDIKTYEVLKDDFKLSGPEIALIDDGPVVLAAAKMAGLVTIRKRNEFFTDNDFEEYNEYVDMTIDSFDELIECL